MLKKMIAACLAASALALVMFGLNSAQADGSLFDFKIEDVTQFQIANYAGHGGTVLFTRTNASSPWHYDSKVVPDRQAGVITDTLQAILDLSPGTPSKSAPPPPDTEAQITTINGVKYTLQVNRNPGQVFLTRQTNQVPGTMPYVSTIRQKDYAELQGRFNGLGDLARRLAAPPALRTEIPKPTEKPPLTPTGTPAPTHPPAATEISPATTTPIPIAPWEQTGLALAGAALCLVLLLALLVLLGATWLRRRKSAPPSVVPYLELETTGAKLYLKRDAMTLGRGADCDLKIARNLPGADTVSQRHARFLKRDARWVVLDGGADDQPSTNGIYVNGKRTLENYLVEDDEIAFGELKFRFHVPTTGLPTVKETRDESK